MGNSWLRSQMPSHPVGPLIVWESGHSMKFPKEVPFIHGHVIDSTENRRLLPGPELVSLLCVVWLRLWFLALYPLTSRGLGRSEEARVSCSCRGRCCREGIYAMCLHQFLELQWFSSHWFLYKLSPICKATGTHFVLQIPCTLLPWLLCTNHALPSLVECVTLAITLALALGWLALKRGNSISLLAVRVQGRGWA